jgi:hypothetical protein
MAPVVNKTPEQLHFEESVQLKDPVLAAFLAWLIPGLGHAYQGRWAKAGLFAVCILGTFIYGAYLGSDNRYGWARVVYFSWREGDRRLPYLCQVGIGLPALPALVQAYRMGNQDRVWFGGFMAPPRLPSAEARAFQPNANDPNQDQPTADDLQKEMTPGYGMGEVYTMIAGLLNVLAIYDAWGGPVFGENAKKDEEDAEGEEGQDQGKDEGKEEKSG